jgi:hypothetical protein
MERTHIITKEDVHQKSTEQVDRGDDTASGITKKAKSGSHGLRSKGRGRI